ncbi:MAG: hypothetical protein ACREB8_14975, partial [Pseudolabrys sp.]
NAKPSDRQVNAMLLKIFIKTSYWTEMEPCAFFCRMNRDAPIHVSLSAILIRVFDNVFDKVLAASLRRTVAVKRLPALAEKVPVTEPLR